MTKLAKFSIVPMQEKLLFLEALFFSFVAKVLLLILPFKYCLFLLYNKQCSHKKPELELLKQIEKAIHRTHWLIFWKNQWLVMSVASRWMLQRRQIHSLLSLGVAFDEQKKLTAHAWLTTYEFAIVENSGNYHELYYF